MEVCLQVLRLHTSLSFGITTEKQHSHLHEKSGVSKRRSGGGEEALALRKGPSLMREKGNQRKQTTIAVFADANSLHLCSSCSKSFLGIKLRLGVIDSGSPWLWEKKKPSSRAAEPGTLT